MFIIGVEYPIKDLSGDLQERYGIRKDIPEHRLTGRFLLELINYTEYKLSKEYA